MEPYTQVFWEGSMQAGSQVGMQAVRHTGSFTNFKNSVPITYIGVLTKEGEPVFSHKSLLPVWRYKNLTNVCSVSFLAYGI